MKSNVQATEGCGLSSLPIIPFSSFFTIRPSASRTGVLDGEDRSRTVSPRNVSFFGDIDSVMVGVFDCLVVGGSTNVFMVCCWASWMVVRRSCLSPWSTLSVIVINRWKDYKKIKKFRKQSGSKCEKWGMLVFSWEAMVVSKEGRGALVGCAIPTDSQVFINKVNVV